MKFGDLDNEVAMGDEDRSATYRADLLHLLAENGIATADTRYVHLLAENGIATADPTYEIVGAATVCIARRRRDATRLARETVELEAALSRYLDSLTE